MDLFVSLCIGLIALLGSFLLSNDLSWHLHRLLGLPLQLSFSAILLLFVLGALTAARFDQLFWYSAIVALFGSASAIALLTRG